MSLGSGIRDPGSGKTYPGSRGQKGTGSRIRKTGLNTLCYRQGNVYPLDVFKQGPGRTMGAEGSRYWEARGTPEITRAGGGFGDYRTAD
jgi:hypothetical protein